VAAEVHSMDRYEKKKNPQSPDMEKKITLEDLENARRKVIKLVQRQTFNEEIAKLVKGLTIKSSSLVRLKPTLDEFEEAILRVGGRISRAPISRDAAIPMILPRKHHVARNFIRFLLERNGHCRHEQS
jgi:L-lactate utilization protein LutB